MNTEKLKPCPFCGSSASLEYTGGDDLDYLTRVEASCDTCEVEVCIFVPTGETRSKESGDLAVKKAVAAWNKRPYEILFGEYPYQKTDEYRDHVKQIAELTKQLDELQTKVEELEIDNHYLNEAAKAFSSDIGKKKVNLRDINPRGKQ